MSKVNVLVLGRSGQLALSLAERAVDDAHLSLSFASRPEVDLEDEASLVRAIRSRTPHVIVNAAAYTAVDRAEAEPEAAARINADAPRIIAREAAAIGARLIHISTDYVFDGKSPSPYSEGAPTDPLNVYGRTKCIGEEEVRVNHPRGHLIVRTSWVYSPFGSNFVKTMLRLAESRPTLTVVGDQIGTPTSALHLADGILAAVKSWKLDPDLGLGETYHLAGTGQTSWAGLAEQVMQASAARGGPSAEVVPITTAEYPTPAKRPSYSILESSKFRSVFGYSSPRWEDGVEEVVERLLAPSR